MAGKKPNTPERQMALDQGVPEVHADKAAEVYPVLRSKGLNFTKVIKAARKLGLDFGKVFDFLGEVFGDEGGEDSNDPPASVPKKGK